MAHSRMDDFDDFLNPDDTTYEPVSIRMHDDDYDEDFGMGTPVSSSTGAQQVKSSGSASPASASASGAGAAAASAGGGAKTPGASRQNAAGTAPGAARRPARVPRDSVAIPITSTATSVLDNMRGQNPVQNLVTKLQQKIKDQFVPNDDQQLVQAITERPLDKAILQQHFRNLCVFLEMDPAYTGVGVPQPQMIGGEISDSTLLQDVRKMALLMNSVNFDHEWRELIQHKLWRVAFDYYDKDGDGILSHEEMNELLFDILASNNPDMEDVDDERHFDLLDSTFRMAFGRRTNLSFEEWCDLSVRGMMGGSGAPAGPAVSRQNRTTAGASGANGASTQAQNPAAAARDARNERLRNSRQVLARLDARQKEELRQQFESVVAFCGLNETVAKIVGLNATTITTAINMTTNALVGGNGPRNNVIDKVEKVGSAILVERGQSVNPEIQNFFQDNLYRCIFLHYGTNGFISKRDMRRVLNDCDQLGIKTNLKEDKNGTASFDTFIDKVYEVYDVDRDGNLNYKQFKGFMADVMRSDDAEQRNFMQEQQKALLSKKKQSKWRELLKKHVLQRIQLKWRAYVAETLGTALLVYCATLFGSSRDILAPATGPLTMYGGFVVAVVLMALIYIMAPISGSHFNPAITVCTMVTEQIGFIDGLAYIFFQCLGATIGSALVLLSLLGSTGSDPITAWTGLGSLSLNPNITPAQGFLIEGIVNFFMILVILSVALMPVNSPSDLNRSDLSLAQTRGTSIMPAVFYRNKQLLRQLDTRKAAGAGAGEADAQRLTADQILQPLNRFISSLIIGFTICALSMVAGATTGGAMNPARWFGPELVSGNWSTTSWVYAVAPVFGSIVAASLYKFGLLRDVPNFIKKIRMERENALKSYRFLFARTVFEPRSGGR